MIESPAEQRKAYEAAASLARTEIATLVNNVKREREKLGSSEFEGYLWDASDEAKANQRAVLDNAKQLLEFRRRQLEIAQDATSEHKKHVEQVKRMQEFRRSSNDLTDNLKEEVARLELGNEEFERRVRLAEALKAGYPNINKNLLDIANQHKNIAEITKLRMSLRFIEVRELQERKLELRAIAEAKKKADEDEKERKEELAEIEKKNAEAKKKALDEKIKQEQKVAKFQKDTLDNLKMQLIEQTKGKAAVEAIRLERGGFSADEARGIAAFREQIEKLQRAKNQSSSVNVGNNTAVDERLVSGRAGASFRKTAEAIEAERQTRIQTAMLEAMNDLLDFERKQPKITVTAIGR